MTKNEFIATVSMRRQFGEGRGYEAAVKDAARLAKELESQGCAPWQDAPVQTVQMHEDGIIRPIQFDLPTRKEITEQDIFPNATFILSDGSEMRVQPAGFGRFTVFTGTGSYETTMAGLLATLNHEGATKARTERREITAADVQPGAIFTDEDGDTERVNSVEDGDVRFTYTQPNGFTTGVTLSMESFVAKRNQFNATVTPPTP